LTISAAVFIVREHATARPCGFRDGRPPECGGVLRAHPRRPRRRGGRPPRDGVRRHTGFAFHERGGPGDHVGVRVSEAECAEIKRRLDQAGIENEERDHEIAIGLFFEDPDGRLLEAITYRAGEDPRNT
jgi:hypothetical protein